MAKLIIGADLGQRQDHTALVVAERTTTKTGKIKRLPGQGAVPVTENHYEVRHIMRLPLGTLYPQQEAAIAGLYHDLKRNHEVSLAVDYTGVGTPVVDSLRAALLPVAAVYIHGGNKVMREGSNYNVPKYHLAKLVLHLLEVKRLGIASGLPEARLLLGELHGFRYEYSASGHLSFGNDVGAAAWREAQHDDLVLATAIACWWGENEPIKRRPFRSYSTSIY